MSKPTRSAWIMTGIALLVVSAGAVDVSAQEDSGSTNASQGDADPEDRPRGANEPREGDVNNLQQAISCEGANRSLQPVPGGWAAPDSRVYVAVVEISGKEDDAGERTVTVELKPAGRLPGGNFSVRVSLWQETQNGTGVRWSTHEDVELTVPPPEEREPLMVLERVRFPWDPEAGMYRLRAEVLAAGADEYGDGFGPCSATLWSERTVLYRVRSGPSLDAGWGRVVGQKVTELDLTGDGKPDLLIRNATTGERSRWGWAVEATAAPWETPTHHGWHLHLSFRPPSRGDAATVTLAGAAAYRILHTSGPGGVILDGASERTSAEFDASGNLTIRLAPAGDGPAWHGLSLSSRSVHPFPHGPRGAGWYDGYETRVNLSAWDLDLDGLADLAFWESAAGTVDAARALAEEARRESPATLVVHAVVNDTPEGRAVDLAIERPGGGERGAWVEVRHPDVLRRALAGEDADPAAPLEYELSLPPEEGFVVDEGNRTWAWIGHFSTQHLRVLAPEASPPPRDPEPQHDATPDDRERAGPEPKGPPTRGVPGPGVILAAATVAAAAGSQLRRARPGRDGER